MSEKKKSKKSLSKSAYIRGRQCLKSLYLYKNRYFLRDPISYEQQLKFRRGHSVGDLAHELFPGGVNLKPGHASKYAKAAEETKLAISAKTPNLYEAVFMTDKYVAIMDILSLKNDVYGAWEVKSSLRISKTYLWDLAFQYFVMSELEFKPESAGIIHVNSEYVYNGNLDPFDFFTKVDLTKEVIALQEETKLAAEEAFEILFADSSPSIDVGPHCFDPYPCEFYSHCHKKHLSSPVLKLAGLSLESKYRLLLNENSGSELCDFEDEFLRRQCEAIKTRKDSFDEGLIEELSENILSAVQPSFLHVLSTRKAVPEHVGDKPFTVVPLAAAIVCGEIVEFRSFENSDLPMQELLSFIDDVGSQLLVFLETDEFLPSDFYNRCEEKEIQLANLYDYFLEGIWCSHVFSPDYSAEHIRNSAMKSRPQYENRLALLLDIDKKKVANIPLSIWNYCTSNAIAVQNILGSIYENRI